MGAIAAPAARALSTTTTGGNPGLPVTSLRGRTFMIGAQSSHTIVNKTQQQFLQDAAGAASAVFAEKIVDDRR